MRCFSYFLFLAVFSFSVGDELGFKESISNVEINRRRSAQASKLQAQLIQAQQKAKLVESKIEKKSQTITTIPPFKPIPPAPERVILNKSVILPTAEFNVMQQPSRLSDNKSSKIMMVMKSKIENNEKLNSNNFAIRTLATNNKNNNEIINESSQILNKLKVITTTTFRPKISTSHRYANSVGKVMNAPKEYYPVGYDKNFDDNFASRVELPETSFYCGDQKHFPGLYADEDLGCMVFHVCALTDDGLIMKSFLCPESTLFDQTILKCNWWFYVDCKNSKKLYDSNIPISKSYQLMKALTFFSAYKKEKEKDDNNTNNNS